MSTHFEGWHYHRSFGVVRKRNVWGMDLRKTYPIVEIALPTPPPPPTDYYHDDFELGNSVDLEDNDYYADLSFSASLDSSCCSSALHTQSSSGTDLTGLGLFGVTTPGQERLGGRLHLSSRDDTPAISELTLNEIYATFCPTKELPNSNQKRLRSAVSQNEVNALTPEKLAMKHSRSTISSQLKARSRPISLSSSSSSSGWK